MSNAMKKDHSVKDAKNLDGFVIGLARILTFLHTVGCVVKSNI